MDAYRIGVSIVLANGVSAVLAIIGKDLLGLRTNVGAIQQDFAKWGTTIAGVGAIMGGATVLGAVTKLAEKAADFQDAMTKVSQLNPKVAALVNSGEMQRMSFGIANQLGMKVEDVTKVYGGVYGALQDSGHAEEVTPYAARYARLMQMRHPGSKPEGDINTLVRAGELSGRLSDKDGKIDPGKVKEWFDMAARLEAATHGQVNAQALLALAQQGGGVSLRGLSQEGYEHMAIMTQQMGGNRAGTALLSLRSQLGGTMMKRTAEAMEEYGMLGKDEWSSEGGHVSIKDEASKRLNGLVSNDPMKFIYELIKNLEAKGITDQDAQMQALQRVLGRQTTQRMVSDMMLSRGQIERETEGLHQGVSVDQGLAGYDKNIHAGQQNLSAAWHNLQVAIGGPEGERFAGILNQIAGAITSMTTAVNKMSPEQIDGILKVVMGLGAGLVVLGGVLTGAVITTLVGAPVLIGAALTGLAAAVGTLVALNWTAVTSMLNGIANAVSGFIDAIMSLYGRVKDFFIPNRPLDRKFGEDLGNANKNYVPMRFTPGNDASKSQQASFSLNVDGRSLAQTVIDHLESIYGMSLGAAAADGMHSPFGGDHQYTSI